MYIQRAWLLLLLMTFSVNLMAGEPLTLRVGEPAKVGMDAQRLSKVDEVISIEIGKQKLPGAVLLVARKGIIVYIKAYGQAQVKPQPEPMTIDKIFDLASLTKPVATATSIMLLVEQGKLRLNDPITKFIPEFTPFVSAKGDTAQVPRLWHLLTHTSGLPAYADTAAIKAQYGMPCPEGVIKTIVSGRKIAPPGEKYVYSCLGYITLAEVIRRVTGKTIDVFALENIFLPLGMPNTRFCPPEEWRGRIVPTEIVKGKPHRGLVHDPLAQLMDRKSGNAGLYSTAADLAIFCQMLLNGGVYGKTRLLSPASVKLMTTVYAGSAAIDRGLGWGINVSNAATMGELFSKAAFGHTGFTGTAILVDPPTQTFIIILSNRVHLRGGDITDLRAKVANIVASSIEE